MDLDQPCENCATLIHQANFKLKGYRPDEFQSQIIIMVKKLLEKAQLIGDYTATKVHVNPGQKRSSIRTAPFMKLFSTPRAPVEMNW